MRSERGLVRIPALREKPSFEDLSTANLIPIPDRFESNPTPANGNWIAATASPRIQSDLEAVLTGVQQLRRIVKIDSSTRKSTAPAAIVGPVNPVV
jgi:hypothetical protein